MRRLIEHVVETARAQPLEADVLMASRRVLPCEQSNRLHHTDRPKEAIDKLLAQLRFATRHGLHFWPPAAIIARADRLVASMRAQYDRLRLGRVRSQLRHRQNQWEGLLPREMAQIRRHKRRREEVQCGQERRVCRHRPVDEPRRPSNVPLVPHVLVERQHILAAAFWSDVPKGEEVAVSLVLQNGRLGDALVAIVVELGGGGIEANILEEARAVRARLDRAHVADARVRRSGRKTGGGARVGSRSIGGAAAADEEQLVWRSSSELYGLLVAGVAARPPWLLRWLARSRTAGY